jgi:hypothetical protein
MKIKVKQVGNKDFPRYALMCENETWWNGKLWTPHQHEAMLYARLSVAKADWKKLQGEIKENVVELQATIRLTVDKPLTPEQIEALAWFMAKASGFTLDYSKKRPDGLEDLNISTKIVWGSLHPVDKKE